MSTTVEHIEHHRPEKTKEALDKKNKNIWLIIGSFLLDMLPVIFGILIAISINGWREKNKEHKLEKFYLRNIKSSAAEEMKRLGSEKDVFTEIKKAQTYILRNTRDIEKFNWQELYPHINVFLSDFSSSIKNTAFIAMQNTGNLNIISNKKILEQLISLYEKKIPFMEHSIELYMNFKRQELIPLMNKTYSVAMLDSNQTKKQMRQLLTSLEYQNIMREIPIEEIIQLYNETIEMYKELDTELGNELS